MFWSPFLRVCFGPLSSNAHPPVCINLTIAVAPSYVDLIASCAAGFVSCPMLLAAASKVISCTTFLLFCTATTCSLLFVKLFWILQCFVPLLRNVPFCFDGKQHFHLWIMRQTVYFLLTSGSSKALEPRITCYVF